MYIEADTLTIYHIETAEADKIVAEGPPGQNAPAARDLDERPRIRARAQVIEYYQREDRVHLRTQAPGAREDGSSSLPVTPSTITSRTSW